jgi:hypothetical protein
MATFSFAGRMISADDAHFPAIAAAAYASVPRPLCMCRAPGIEMYIARVGGRHIIKRMPETGGLHAMSCASYEPPPELSGLGEILGGAVQTNPLDGTTALKLDFSMSKQGASSPLSSDPQPGTSVADHVGSGGARLSLRSALHYLWGEAGFHRWSPAMAGKRSWFVVRKYLLQAAQDKLVKGVPLGDALYIPESFELDKKDAIAGRRNAAFARHARLVGTRQSLMLLVGEVKEIGRARFGQKLIIKHAPDCVFLLRTDIAQRLTKRFAPELELWAAMDDLRLMVFGTFSVSQLGVPSMEELTLMLVTEQWIPLDGPHDKTLVDRLVRDRRRFDKGMRYNLEPDQPVASAVLCDTEAPVALYLVAPRASAPYCQALESLQAESAVASWTWNCGDQSMPALPAVRQVDNSAAPPT